MELVEERHPLPGEDQVSEISVEVIREAVDTRTTAQRWADNVTEFSGSWPFIGWFAAFCAGWIFLNATSKSPWDPYPFLFLNWVLTMVSTFQSPLILLSQNRQNENDRQNVQEILRRLEEERLETQKILRELRKMQPANEHEGG